MQFPTFTFSIFFLVVLIVWWGCLPKLAPRGRAIFLAAASVVFYAWADARWAVVLLAVATVAWAGSRWIDAVPSDRRRVRGWITVATLAGTLVAWKYIPWLVLERNGWVEGLGWAPWPLPEWAYPAGLSFFTFHALALVLSVWHGRSRPLGWLDALAHVSFFPTLLAGPVLQAGAVAPRLAQSFRWDDVPWLEGVVRVLIGMTFKWVLASKAAEWAEPVFQGVADGRAAAWWGVHAYAAQIFFDFAGYSYIAIGVALLLGFRLPENFAQPYTAPSLQEFWRRWHRSLSTFFRDHLYIDALGGNRHGTARALAAAAFTMIVSGLWHGASVLFLVWGAWHAIGLLAERLCPGRSRWPRTFGWVVSFQFVVWGWVWFRADTWDTAVAVFAQGWGPSVETASSINPWAGGAWLWAGAMVAAVACEKAWAARLMAACHRTDVHAVSLWRAAAWAGMLATWAWALMAFGPVGVPAFIYNGF